MTHLVHRPSAPRCASTSRCPWGRSRWSRWPRSPTVRWVRRCRPSYATSTRWRRSGWPTPAPAASFLVALAVAGAWADRRGPLPVLRTGVAAFAAAQLLVGLAWAMPVVVVGRLVSGVGEALVDVSLMVLVARVLPPQLRPRMFSLVSAAWVLPSVVGPGRDRRGHRAARLAVGVPRRAGAGRRRRGCCCARRSARPRWVSSSRARASRAPGSGGRCSREAGARLTLAGEHLSVGDPVAWARPRRCPPSCCSSASSGCCPPGTLRGARGLPAVVAVRGLVSLAFGGVGAFLPLLLTLLHGFRPATAGISLTVTGVTWAFGSWLQGQDTGLRRPDVLRAGLAFMTVGLAVATLLAVPGLPPWWGLAGWALAGVGMGISSSTLSVLVLDLSRDDEQGRSNGAAQTSAAAGMAVGLAFGGALVAARRPHPGRWCSRCCSAAGPRPPRLGALMSGRVTSA